MSTVGVVLVHGRSQQMAVPDRPNTELVQAHTARLRRQWEAGLAKGLILAEQQPLPDQQVYFPFYGNAFMDAIDARIAAGGGPPDIELAEREIVSTATRDELVLELAESLNFDPATHTGEADREQVAEAWTAREEGREFQWSSLLKSTVVSAALRFIARKTGAAELAIETLASDVAYYLEVPEIRDTVLQVVRDSVQQASSTCDSVVLISHSLGTIVAYDMFAGSLGSVPIDLLVTAGSPLGLPIVQRNLLTSNAAQTPQVPQSHGSPVPWLNAFDVRDVVALIHPLDGAFTGTIRDERTFNHTDPHSIEDYLSDPDVAGPIGRALSLTSPW
jgi:hypothetical protein